MFIIFPEDIMCSPFSVAVKHDKILDCLPWLRSDTVTLLARVWLRDSDNQSRMRSKIRNLTNESTRVRLITTP